MAALDGWLDYSVIIALFDIANLNAGVKPTGV